jgi:phosphate/sulfate permease
VLLSAALVVACGTVFAVPIATMHAVVGGLVGVALLSAGLDGVSWNTVLGVAGSWLLSPALGGAFAVACRYSLRLAAARHARYKVAIPLLSGFTACASSGLVAISAPQWLVRKWLPGAYWAAAANVVLFTAAAGATAGFMRRNAGTSVASLAVYNVAEDEDDDDVHDAGAATCAAGDCDVGDVETARHMAGSLRPAEVFVVDSDMSGDADDADVDADDEDWAGGTFVLDERAPIFQLLLAGTTAAIAFAHGSTDVAIAMAPLGGIVRYYRARYVSTALSAAAESGVGRAAAANASSDALPAAGRLASARLHPAVTLAGGLAVAGGLVLFGGGVMATMGQVNKRSKLSFARSSSVHLSAVLSVLATKWLGLPVSTSYCVVASHAVSSVAYVPPTERALERVHEGLDVRLLAKMAVLAAAAPGTAAVVAVFIRLSLRMAGL